MTSPGVVVEREVTTSVVIGRKPGRSGIVIGNDDTTVSRAAVRVVQEGRLTSVENLSRHTKLEIQSEAAVRSLLPGESLRLTRDTLVVVPGHSHPFRIEISGVRAPARPRHSARGSLTLRAVARPLRRGDDQRQLALVALCLPRFDPRRFLAGLLTAPQIAEQLRLAGEIVTAKEINNKLLRLRRQLGDDYGVFLGSRDELAVFAIAHDLVTMNDVKALKALQQLPSRGLVQRLARSQPRRA